MLLLLLRISIALHRAADWPQQAPGWNTAGKTASVTHQVPSHRHRRAYKDGQAINDNKNTESVLM